MRKINQIEKFLGFDTETTGVDVKNDRIIQVALIETKKNEADNPRVSLGTNGYYINPHIPVPAGAQAVHNISNDVLDEEGVEPEVGLEMAASKIVEAISEGTPIVAYNAGFDLNMLKFELLRYGLPTLEDRLGREVVEILDPYCLDRCLDRDRPGKRKLEDLSDFYNLPVVGVLHNADYDTMMTLDILEAILKKFPEVEEMTLAEAFEFQKKGYREWAENRNKWAKENGRSVIGTSWLRF